MSPKLSTTSALNYAVSQLATRGGAILVAAYAAYQIATQVVIQSLFVGVLGSSLDAAQLSQAYPLAVGLPTTVSAVLTVAVVLAGTALGVVAMRALYEDIDAVPTADHTRRLVRTVGVLFVVSVIVFVATTIGFVFLVLPGLFLAVSLVFAALVVAVEDAGIGESLKRSWELASGNRLRLFLLGVVVVIGSGLAGVVGTLFGGVGPLVSALLTSVVSGLVSLFSVAVLVGAYRQLAGEDGVETSVAA
ncbi:hypothetical protein M0R88_14585 [Halorussus gelatinilyticus]|uniref:DUF7847 domain-containing protein n=1 Tax=Halorussus gelatinilyticus TaxID=2937524 RepID=A0A8U0IG72_9EURY|nr:hypothetical protein [Halorussus gelatinilyticus]UPV99734.1 hypothetical protein M0R88_14585 [Halorussus gelatinilyticus]